MEPTLKRILLVEDDLDIQSVARIVLEDLGGFEVEVASSGGVAVETSAAFRPDLILLDFMLPDQDGRQTLKDLRATSGLETIPVVFMTARAQPGELEEYRRCGAIDVIVKPFDPMTLADKVRQIWESYRESPQPSS